MLWPITAVAAAGSLSQAFTTPATDDWLAVLALSTVSGLVTLLQRIRKNLEAGILQTGGQPFDQGNKLLLDWRVFAGFHMTGCYMAGFVAFLIGEHLALDNYLHALTIALFSWMGAAILDRMAGDGSTWLSRVFSAIFSSPGKAD